MSPAQLAFVFPSWRCVAFQATIYTLLALVNSCSSCGVSTHIEIGHRATEFFSKPALSSFGGVDYKQLIQRHQDAFQAGNTFPDTFYTSVCFKGIYHSVSEDTHWTPFTNVTIEYIRKNIPQPWDQEAEKLVVFLLGFVSHQVADVSWHSLGIQQGFIRTMAAMDFHGAYGDAHSVADLGADVINEFRGDYSYIHPTEWYIPVAHLVKIYNIYYKDRSPMTREVIETCTAIIYAAVLGEKIALKELYPSWVEKSPFLNEQLDTFFLGGQYDMAMWTTRIWRNVIHLLENGFRSDCVTPESPLFIRCNLTKHYSPQSDAQSSQQRLQSMKPANLETFLKRRVSLDDILVKRSKMGVLYQPSNRILTKLKGSNGDGTRRLQKHDIGKKAGTIFFSKTPYARLGDSILAVDVNGDGYEDLLISAPMYGTPGDPLQGAVYIIYGSSGGLPVGKFDVDKAANQTLFGPPGRAGKFGSSLEVLDLNHDGRLDLAIGAPNIGADSLTYTGSVFVYHGEKDGKFNTLTPLEIMCSLLYCGFGAKLYVADINQDKQNDLVIGAPYAPALQGPQTGMICIVYSSRSISRLRFISHNYNDCITPPPPTYGNSWFGFTLTVADLGALRPVMLVGSPFYRNCSLSNCTISTSDQQSVGAITGYQLPSLKQVSLFVGDDEHGHVGGSMASVKESNTSSLLAFSASFADVNGSVLGMKVRLPQAGVVALYSIEESVRQLSLIKGDRMFGSFGSNIQLTDIDDDTIPDLIVTSPRRSSDPTLLVTGAEQGEVYIFAGKDNYPVSDFGEVCGIAAIQPCPGKLANRVLTWGEDKAHFGHSLSVFKQLNQTKLAVSAIRSGLGARLGGAVGIF